MLFAEFDLPSTLTNSGIAVICVWCFYKISEKQIEAFQKEMAAERVRADGLLATSMERAEDALSKERHRHEVALTEERSRAEAHFLDERKVWTGVIGNLAKRVSSLDSTVRQHLDHSQANGHSNGQ